MSETVFILGAGASKEAGAPVMSEFLDKADEIRRTSDLGIEAEDFERVFRAISALQAVHSKSELDLENLESVFAALEMGRLTGKLPGFEKNQIEQVLSSFRKLITRTLDTTIAYPIKDNSICPTEHYLALAYLIALMRRMKNNNASVITFNYDVALDFALNYASSPPDYCLDGTAEPNSVPLLKLHGSLNWARCQRCKGIVPWTLKSYFKDVPIDVIVHSSKVKGLSHACLDFTTRLPGAGLKHCGMDFFSDPVIVPPTWNKTEYNAGLQGVWARAALELSSAENIFVLGYSLNETDLFFRYLYALGAVGDARIKKFWVYDPDIRNVANRFERLLGPGAKAKFVPHDMKFGLGVEHIAKAVLGKSWKDVYALLNRSF